MLTNLLPGVRELRAPLSAGFLWLLAIWLIAEPSVPVAAQATGPMASLYRLGSGISVVGASVALGFAAYLVGSLSIFVFSGLLTRLVVTSVDTPWLRLDGLSRSSRESLKQIASDGVLRLQEILSLSGASADDVIARDPDSARRGPTRRRARGSKAVALRSPRIGGHTDLADENGVWGLNERKLAQEILRDLEIVADVQLLGKEADAFSAVDRRRAEVEFRLGVIPAIVALALTLAATQRLVPGLLIAAAALAAAVGLLLDAARQKSAMNGLLLGFMEHGRMQAPSLLRMQVRATERADQSPAKVLAREAAATAEAFRTFLDSLAMVPASAPVTGLTNAVAAEVDAQAKVQRLDRLVGQARTARSVVGATELLDRLGRVLRAWALLNHGALTPTLRDQLGLPDDSTPPIRPIPEDLVHDMATAREEYATFVDQLREIVADVTTAEAARQTVSPSASS